MNALRITLSQSVSRDVLRSLHKSGLVDDAVKEVRDLVSSAGGQKLTSVYRVSPEEIDSDRYGFARQFKVYLAKEAEISECCERLRQSSLVEKVEPVAIARASNAE